MMWRLLSSFTRGFRSVRPTHCCSQEPSDEKSRKHFDFRCHHLSARRLCHTSQQTPKPEYKSSDGAKYIGHCVELSGGLETQKDHSALQKRTGHDDWKVFCNVDFKEKQSKWGRSCRWKSRERFLWTHSILQGLGWGSVVAFTYSLYQGWGDLQQVKEGRYAIHKWYNEKKECHNGHKKDFVRKRYEGSQLWNNGFVRNHRSSWFQYGHQSSFISSLDPGYQHRHQTSINTSSAQELSKSLFFALWNLADVQKDFSNALKRNVIDVEKQTDNYKPIDDGIFGDVKETELKSVDPLYKPESKFYTQEDTVDTEDIIIGCDAFYKLENEPQIEESVLDIKEVGGKPFSEVGKGTQDNFSSNDSGHSSGTKRQSVHQGSEEADSEDFDDNLKKILKAGVEDIKKLQGELRNMIQEDFARSSGSSNPGAAIVYFQAGTMLGDPNSTFNLALCHHFGRGVKQDMRKARNLYEAASQKGHGGATFNLAILVSQGQGGTADLPLAKKLLALAAERGVAEAGIALQQIEEEEEIEEEDVYEQGGLSRTQSEPTLSTIPSSSWSSSYSTTDLDFMEDSLGFVSTEINVRTRPVFHLT